MSSFIPGTKIKVAIIGCGRIARKHAEAIHVNSNKFQIIALCDADSDFLSAFNNELVLGNHSSLYEDSCPHLFTNYLSLIQAHSLGDIQIDIVILTTPSGLHSQQAILAAKHNINVCTEKPMATTFDDGEKMLAECNSHGVKLFVVKQNRLNPTIQLLKRQLVNGRFGRLSCVTSNVFWQRPQSYYDSADWRGTWEHDGGALMNQASHYVDLLTWLIGPLHSLSASIATIGRSIEVEDTAVLQMRWKQGCLGTLAVTMLTYPKNLEASITILGEKGTVKVGGPAVNEILHWDFEDDSIDDQLSQNVSYQISSVYGNGHGPYYADIYDALVGIKTPTCDGSSGLESLAVIESAYLSSKKGEVIYFK